MNQTKKKNSILLVEISTLVVIWLVVFISPIFVQYNNAGFIRWELIFHNWLRLLPLVALSLVNHFVLVPLLFFNSRKVWYLVTATLAIFMLVFTMHSVYRPNKNNLRSAKFNQPHPRHQGPVKKRPPAHANRRPRNGAHELGAPPRMHTPAQRPGRPPGALPPHLNTAIIALLILGFDTGLLTIFKLTKSEQEKSQVEKERIKSELAFLRNQVSPHFLMNTLNNIHALIDFDSDKAKDTLIRLSKLMRYLLYDTGQEEIALDQELTFISSYVDLMNMRVNENVEITFETKINDERTKIPPLIFTSLIENAFKYGISYEKKSFVRIYLETTDKELIFKLSNSIVVEKSNGNSHYSGIGLENTRKRLDIIYGNNYKMDIQTNNNIFRVLLNLPL
ncbi:MAG: histidine kinase [Bacteroidales bacterium]|nr:histidine kinase [Bacteroidales bacterium]